MDKKLIHQLLAIKTGDDKQQVKADIAKALRLILEGVQAHEVRQEHAMHFIAASIGFLASGSYREAARAAAQAVSGLALPAADAKATPEDLLRGLSTIDRLEP
jgi:hypothetical protein